MVDLEIKHATQREHYGYLHALRKVFIRDRTRMNVILTSYEPALSRRMTFIYCCVHLCGLTSQLVSSLT
jgi:hypothetical protein